MYRSKKVLISSISEQIKEISILHRTGQSRVITISGKVYDVKFSDLVASLNGACKNFPNRIHLKYCLFSVKQFEKLVSLTNYSICKKSTKNKEFGYLETDIKYIPRIEQITF